ncbi:MAG: acyl-CoA dehydrogenase, partial [Syntrophomonadaceae bacterium]|nr:acyl-CoA dehydrogenase [Syntrophomonadaceae bacterium]
MDFRLTEEQELIRASAREFTQKYLEPIAAELDEESRYPAEVMAKLAEMDWLGIPYPTEYGGAGSDYLTFAIVIEEISRACASTGFTVSATTGLVLTPIFQFGTEEQKKKFMIPLCKGEKVGAFALTEPGAGTDPASATTTAVLEGDEYVINGTKTFVSNGPLADIFVVIAVTDKTKGARGMSAFVVPKEAGGITVGKHFKK